MYQFGAGFEDHVAEAVKWFRNAADQEYNRGLFNLGVMYETGVGVGKDKDMAKALYEKAAELGYEQATERLKLLSGERATLSEAALKEYSSRAAKYYNEQNYTEALKNYLVVADYDDAYAQYMVGWLYKNGKGTTLNYREASKWLLKAANQGNISAMNELAILYENGNGVGQNLTEAVRWYRNAANKGNKYAQYN